MNQFAPYLGALKAVAIIAALLAVFGFGHRTGAQGVQAKWDRERLAAVQQAENNRLLRQAAINRIDRTGAARAKRQAATDQSIADKVQHVPLTLPLLPGTFRVLHDAAASGQAVDDSRALDADPVAPRTVARTLASNYADARADKANLEELQAIIRASGCFAVGDAVE